MFLFSFLTITPYRASDGSYTVDSSIVVTVVPVDDEPPVFNPASYTTAISEAAIAGRENNLSLLLNCVLQKYYHFLGAYCTVFFFYNVAKYFQKLIEEWSNHDMYL